MIAVTVAGISLFLLVLHIGTVPLRLGFGAMSRFLVWGVRTSMEYTGAINAVGAMESTGTAFLKHTVLTTVILRVWAFIHGSFKSETAAVTGHGNIPPIL